MSPVGNYSVWCFTLLENTTSYLGVTPYWCIHYQVVPCSSVTTYIVMYRIVYLTSFFTFFFFFFYFFSFLAVLWDMCLCLFSAGIRSVVWFAQMERGKNTQVKINPPRNVLHNTSSNTCVCSCLFTQSQSTMHDWALVHRLNLPQTSAVWARDTSPPHMDRSIRSSYRSKVWDLSDFAESMNQWWQDLTEPRGDHPQQMMHLHLI